MLNLPHLWNKKASLDQRFSNQRVCKNHLGNILKTRASRATPRNSDFKNCPWMLMVYGPQLGKCWTREKSSGPQSLWGALAVILILILSGCLWCSTYFHLHKLFFNYRGIYNLSQLYLETFKWVIVLEWVSLGKGLRILRKQTRSWLYCSCFTENVLAKNYM